jgi:aspartate dehydrogenase
LLRIGLIGAGVMGSLIARAIDAGAFPGTLVALADLDANRAATLAGSLAVPPEVSPTREVVAAVDLVVEAAAPEALPVLLDLVAEHGNDLLVLSVGGLIDQEDRLEEARRTGSRVYCPSGAIAGLDGVRAAAEGRIDGAQITTRKPPAGLLGAPFFRDAGMDPERIESPTVVFEGSAREACARFPQNVNVSAALSLAGVGVDRTRVRIIADPGLARNVHTIEVWGDFGTIRTETENVPSENPRTSRLAALSAIALIRSFSVSLRVGT